MGTAMWNEHTGTGDSTGESTGETTIVRALAEPVDAQLFDAETPGEDPYNRTFPSLSDEPAKPKRRSLDDMRRLSETIKAGRSPK